MRVAIITGTAEHQTRAAGAFASGLKRHGITPQMCSMHPRGPVDLVVMWAYRRAEIIRRSQRGEFRLLVMEHGYLGDRSQWTSLGYGGLNGYADFCNADAPGDRLAHYFGDLLRPWRHDRSGYALIMGQVPGDASLRGMSVAAWANECAATLRDYGWDVRFRPHPKREPDGRVDCETAGGTLAEAVAGAAFVVTYNSNSGVDAVCAGVPTVTMDPGAMAWAVTSHSLADPLVTPDRQRWAERLAYCQWLPHEIANGTAWEHIGKGMKAPLAGCSVEKITTESRCV